MMKTMINLVSLVLMSIVTAATFTACSNYMEYDETDYAAAQTIEAAGHQRTVLVYMAGRNNLSYFATADLEEMKQGSLQLDKNQVLLVFMRRNYDGEEPWLARIENGEVTNKVTASDMGINTKEFYASDPEVMEKVMNYAFSQYPSVNDDYGLVLWGHGGGWLMQDSISVKPQRRGFGVDVGEYIYSRHGKWINMPTMTNILSRMPHLKFIFADCCNFMCLESLYELRHVADYIIGSPAEIPANGAPYQTVVPAMFEPTDYCHSIVERYYEHEGGNLPLTVIKTSEMEHVAQATKQAMKSMTLRQLDGFPDLTGMIHYNYLGTDSVFHHPYNIFYDAGDFMRRYATPAEYQEWRAALDRAIVETHIAYVWKTDKRWDVFFTDFRVSPEKYHGVSMFIPQDPSVKYGELYYQFNHDIQRMQWLHAIDE